MYFVLLWLLMYLEQYDGSHIHTYYKRKLIYHGYTYDWEDSVSFCYDKGGYLVNVDDKAVREAIYYYGETSQGRSISGWANNDWGNQIWTGLFVYDKTSSAVIMKMQGVCQIYEYLNEYSPWDSDTPSTSNLDFTKRCVVLKSKDLTFILEKCSQVYSFICQVNMGECTFEKQTGTRCATSYDTTLMQITSDINACYLYCKTLTSGTNNECWAVTYDSTTKLCYPSMGTNPFGFENSVTNCGSMISPSLSQRRCFQAEENSQNVPSVSNPNPEEPLPICSFVIPTTSAQDIPTTTTTQPQTTTRLLTTTQKQTTTEVVTTTEVQTTTENQPIASTEVITTTEVQTTTETQPIASTEVITMTEVQTTTENQPIASTEVITTTEGQTIVGANTQTHSASTSPESTAITSVGLYEDLTTSVGLYEDLTTSVGLYEDLTTSVVTYNNSHCTCNCTGTNNKTLTELVEQLVSELRIDPKNTSLAKRKLVSVRDMSTPNNVIGSGMCFLLIVGVGFFLCPDFVSVVWWIKDKLCS